MRTKIAVLGAATLALALDLPAQATSADQGWPARPVTMVVPLAAGSGLDIVGRTFAPKLGELLGQSIVVENVGAAGGMTGAARVAKAPPDGYQFLLGTVGTHAQNQSLYKRPLYNAATDFTPVALIAEQPTVLITRKDLPANNLAEFIAYAKANQAKMQYGSAGSGSAAHLACALLNATIEVRITHVPYRGGAGAMQDLLAGRVDFQCPATTIAAPQIEAKLVNPLAVLGKDRAPNLPAVASAQEQGLADFEAGIWYAVFMPPRTPIVNKFHSALLTTIKTPAVKDRLKEIGATLVGPERRSPDYLQKFVVSEIAKWAALIKAAGLAEE